MVGYGKVKKMVKNGEIVGDQVQEKCNIRGACSLGYLFYSVKLGEIIYSYRPFRLTVLKFMGLWYYVGEVPKNGIKR